MDGEVEVQLQRLEKQLRETSDLLKTIEQRGAKSEADRLRRKYEAEEDAEDLAELDLPRIPSAGLKSAIARRNVDNLNKVLRRAAHKLKRGKIDGKIVSTLWGRYGVARTALAESWSSVPPRIWECLWDVLASEPENPTRMPHIYVLAKDMTAAGVPLSGSQQLLAVEAMFIEGRRKEAIDNWKRLAGTLGSQDESFRDYWELGIRMCSISGDLERAERAVETLLRSTPDASPRFLFQLLRGFAGKGMKDKAWDTYARLRGLLGSSMRIEDYDEVISAFLLAGETEYAFHIFVEMMFSGAINVHGNARLPSSVSNQFFLGKWLKRLIGAGDLDGAHNVLKFMQTKGIMPAAVQVNGLIGAWLRSGTAGNQQEADRLAWKMIESRRVFVDLRRREAALEWPIRLLGRDNVQPSGEESAETGELVFVPKATLETYSLMAENYKARGMHRRLEELWVAFKEAEIATDAFMMNQLLESYVMDGNPQGAREMYSFMVHEHQVLPDAFTFLTLYKSLSVNRLIWLSLSDEQKAEDALLCRRIFNDMLRSSWAFVGKDDEAVLQDLGRTVLHTFRKVRDLVGLIVALSTLRQVFGFKVSEAITIEMIAETGVRRDSPRVRKRVFKASEIIEYILARRKEELAASGEDEDADIIMPHEKENELASVLEYFFRNKVTRTHLTAPDATMTDGEFQTLYDEAAQDLGVDDSLAGAGRPRSRPQAPAEK